MKESSASRNGLLINERIVEVDGRNVMAFKVTLFQNTLRQLVLQFWAPLPAVFFISVVIDVVLF